MDQQGSYFFLFKVPMKWKIIAGYLKGFSKYRRMSLSFLKYLFFILKILTFWGAQMGSCVFVLWKLGRWWRNKLWNQNGKILNQEYLYKYWSSVLQTWCQKCTSWKKQNDTCGAVAMTTALPLVLFKLKLKVSVFVLTKYHPLPAI